MPLSRANRPPSKLARAARPRPLRTPEPIPSSHSLSAYGLAELLGTLTPESKVTASEGTVTGLPAVQAGVDMVAHAVAAMMTDADVYDAGGVAVDPLPAVVDRPAVLLGSYEFWTQCVDTLMKRGNYVAVRADTDRDGYPRQVVPVHPDSVSLDDSTGIPVYTIGGSEYQWDEVLHVRHGAPVGRLWGAGIVERYRWHVGEQLAQAEYGRTSFATGGVPSAHVQLDKPTVSQDETDDVDTRWAEKFGNGVRKPLVTGKAISITPLSWSPHDAEYVESKRINVAQAAFMCGLDPADLGASIASGGGLTYANLTDRQLARILQSFMPWMRLVEEAWSDLLPGRTVVKGNPEALLRSSTLERFQVYQIGRDLGVYTTDELRELERRPTIQTEEDPDG